MNLQRLLFMIMMWGNLCATISQEPHVVIVFVIDQFPYYYLQRLQPHLQKGGFNRFVKEGVLYTKAYHAHGVPETTPGHSTLSTGVLPVNHGATSNRWFQEGKSIEFSADKRKSAAVLNAPSSAPGRSPLHLEVDTISDQMGIHQATKHVYKAYSMGIKETSAIATAGQHMPAFWFNRFQGGFTSSRHYMRELPKWVKHFNERSGVKQLKKVSWDLRFDRKSDAYDFPFIDNYEFAALPFKLAGNKEILIDHTQKDPFANYLRTPASNQLILDFAVDCLQNVYKKNKNEKILLWVCLSPLDLLGHMYGPQSLEVTDFIYHLDQQLYQCMTKIETMVSKTAPVTFILTADHGVQPIQEISQKLGMPGARRIMAKELMDKINQEINRKFGVEKLLANFESTYFIYDENAADQLEDAGQLDAAEAVVKSMLKAEAGIHEAWSYAELKQMICRPDSAEQFYKNHLVKGRLGDIIVQPKPYCLVTNYPTGCSHNTPYEYDTHVPLAFYQKGIQAKKIRRTVYTSQLAPSIAQLLDIPAPSASTSEMLPHLLMEA